jgi:adenosine kinase
MHRVSLSFLVDTMDKRRGGCAPEHRVHAGAARRAPAADGDAGEDFGEYRPWLDAAASTHRS